ncbi:UBX domain-containing protein 4-like isoform X2 [Ornithodoros turicata]
MASTYETEEVSTKLHSCDCVAIKLTAGSEPCEQFAQIYPVVVIPSTFFIGCNGIPLEVIAGSVTPEEFIDKINKVMQGPSVNQTLAAPGTSEGDVNPSLSSTAGSNASVPPLEDRVERAKRLVEERRLQKQKEEEEEAKALEQERRRVSRELQMAKQSQSEEEMREWARKRAQEKQEERLHRERIQAQIAQDRADRAERYQRERAKEDIEKHEQAAKLAKVQQEKDAIEAAAQSQQARIQFRLPDGSSATHTFEADATLQELHNFVIQTIQPGFTTFNFSIMFPRREFTRDQYGQTLRELQLAPSSVILVVPVQAVVPAPSGNSLMTLLWAVFSPLLFLWKLASSFLFGSPPAQPVAPESGRQPAPPDSPRATDAEEQSGARRRRPQQGRGRGGNVYQRHGNIYRFSNQRSSDDDDDTNTWNGNSTQQM